MRGATGSRPVLFLEHGASPESWVEACSTWNKASQLEVVVPTGLGAFHVEQTTEVRLL